MWPREGVKVSNRARSNDLSEYRQKQLSSSSIDRIVSPMMEGLYDRAKKITPAGVTTDTKQKLVIAGLSSSVPLEALLGMKLLSSALGFMAALAWAPVDSFAIRVLVSLGAAAAGFVAPNAIINRKAAERQAEIQSSLPEVLDQLTVVVEAGLGFDSALKRVVASSQGHLIDEFARALRAMRLGLKRSEALEQIADRTDVSEVRQFVAAIKQADALGVPIAKVLRTQSVHMREIQRLSAEEAAMRLPVKLTFPMVFCMLPALFVITIGPVAVRVVSNGIGS